MIFTKEVITVLLSMHTLSCAVLAQFIYIDYIRAVCMVIIERAFEQVADWGLKVYTFVSSEGGECSEHGLWSVR